jgi:ATP-dependent Zn protease
MSEADRRGAAFHEAGHAVVAWALGLPVGEIEIGMDGDDAAGRCQIGDSTHLPIVDQLAICLAGIEAQHLFDCPTHELAGAGDFGKVIEMIEDGISEAESRRLRDAGYQRAHSLLNAHKEEVRALAALLVRDSKIDAHSILPSGR